MSFKIIIRGTPTRTIVADYFCDVHGRFELEVERTPEGDAPAEVPCPIAYDHEHHCEEPPCSDCGFTIYECGLPAVYCISAPLTKVRAIEAIKGKSQKPEFRTWTDTRAMGEGQPLNEWQEDRAAIWEEKRRQDVVNFARAHNERVIGGD